MTSFQDHLHPFTVGCSLISHPLAALKTKHTVDWLCGSQKIPQRNTFTGRLSIVVCKRVSHLNAITVPCESRIFCSLFRVNVKIYRMCAFTVRKKRMLSLSIRNIIGKNCLNCNIISWFTNNSQSVSFIRTKIPGRLKI